MPPTVKKLGDAMPQIPRIGRLTVDQVITESTTLEDAVGMVVPLEIGEYEIELVTSAETEVDGNMKVGWTAPVGCTLVWARSALWLAPLNFSDSMAIGDVDTEGTTGTGGDPLLTRWFGLLKNPTNVGNLQLQVAQVTADTTSTVYRDFSYIKASPIFPVPA